MNSVYRKELWALSPEAAEAVHQLVASGYEHDLAIAILEGFFGETIYLLPDERDERDERNEQR